MEFCWKSIEHKVVLFGLLLPLLVLNRVECQCNYYQDLKDGQTYYAYSPNYPNYYQGENHCIWKMASPNVVKINCTIEMYYSCNQDRLSVAFAEGIYSDCGYKTTAIVQGTNPTIKLDTLYYNSTGRFLCEIKTENNNNNCRCGWKKVTRIVGGEETGVNEYPMMGGLVDSRQKMIYCGCTIISEQYVVTAAHCIENRDISIIGVVVGEHDVTTGRETNATRLIRLIECIIHPGYQSNKDAYDVAVCKVAEKIIYSAEVGPACLPFKRKRDSFAGDTVTATGWGLMGFAEAKATKLQKVDLNVITLDKCKQSYSNVNANNMCTYTPGKDTCQMDSGGPLLWENPKTHNIVLVGITSSGTGCASDAPAVAMCTGPFTDWIVSVTPDAQYCQVE